MGKGHKILGKEIAKHGMNWTFRLYLNHDLALATKTGQMNSKSLQPTFSHSLIHSKWSYWLKSSMIPGNAQRPMMLRKTNPKDTDKLMNTGFSPSMINESRFMRCSLNSFTRLRVIKHVFLERIWWMTNVFLNDKSWIWRRWGLVLLEAQRYLIRKPPFWSIALHRRGTLLFRNEGWSTHRWDGYDYSHRRSAWVVDLVA